MAKGKYEEWINDSDKLILLSGWARNGLSDEQIAKNVGISRSTLNEWKKKYPVISDALKKVKKFLILRWKMLYSKRLQVTRHRLKRHLNARKLNTAKMGKR